MALDALGKKWFFKKNISLAKLCNIMELQHKDHGGKRGQVTARF